MFHVSQLKEALPVKHQVATLPNSLTGLQFPEKVLQRRVVTTDITVVLQGLIKWSGLHHSLATWEDIEALQQRFPRAPAWGQAGSKGVGGVTTDDTSADCLKMPEVDAGPSTVVHPATATKKSSRTRLPSVRVHGPQWA